MMTQSVMTQATNLLGSAKGSVTSKSKQTGRGFELFMDKNLKSGPETASITEASGDQKKEVQGKSTNYEKNHLSDKNVQKRDINESTDETSKAEKAVDEVNDSKGTDKTTDRKETDGTAGEDTKKVKEGSERGTVRKIPKDELVAGIIGMLQQVRQAVMEILQLTPEELDQLIAKCSTKNGEMSTADLLQPDTLRQLVLANSGKEDLLSLLTDENLADTMKQLIQTVGQIEAEADLSLTSQQIKSILEQVKADTTQSDSLGQNTLQTADSAMPKEVIKSGLVAEQVAGQSTAENDSKAKTDANAIKENLIETAKLPIASETTGAQADTTGDDNFEAENQFQAFMDKMVQVTQITQVDFSGNVVQLTELRDIANQIIEHIKVVVTPELSSMELQLNPEELGKVNLSVQSKNGVMTAQFVVQNESCREAIESQMHTLRETLSQQGIKVDSIEVTVSANAFEQNAQADQENQTESQKNQSGRKISLEDAIAMSELPEEENSVLNTDGVKGSQIDYTA